MSGRGRKPMLSESMAAAPWRGGGTMARRPGAAPRRRHQSGGTVARRPGVINASVAPPVAGAASMI